MHGDIDDSYAVCRAWFLLLPAGFMPCLPLADAAVSFSRLVCHLQRVWDYESCDEAALKIWLAQHLIARGNEGESPSCAGNLSWSG